MAELDHARRLYDLQPRSVFVGGGTPTYLRPELWTQLLHSLREFSFLDAVTEFTVEANPETVTPQLAGLLARGGVNRVSLGAQSFHPHLLKTLERWHDPANVGRAVRTLRDAGISNINLDLIFAVPGQDLAMLDLDLDHALALEPTHLSCYGLTYEPNTAITQRLKMGQVQPVDEDVEAAMYRRVMQRLAEAGFEHYEVSNWARPGRRCEHNLLYWRNGNWLGAGPSAASHVDGRRWKNAPHLGRYLDAADAPPIVDDETLTPERRVGEQLMLRLRLMEGAPLDWLHGLLPPRDARWAMIDELETLQMLHRRDGHLRLTDRGLMVADSVIARLL